MGEAGVSPFSGVTRLIVIFPFGRLVRIDDIN
jgi:hypothetical protein